MILDDLERKIEEYRKLLEYQFKKPPYYPQIKIERKSNHPTVNLLEDFLVNYNTEYFYFYEKIRFLSPEERPNIEGSIVFAENTGSNFCYVYNLEYEGRIFCVNLDTGDYMWEAAKSYESFFQIFIAFLDMEMTRFSGNSPDLTDDEYRAYFNKCMSIVGGDKDLEEYIKFMCCIVD